MVNQIFKSCLSFLIFFSVAYAERIKDIVDIQGVRSNQLIGYGLVVGLDGTGDSSSFTKESFKEMLRTFGVSLPSAGGINTKNIAAVSVSAELPPFARLGQSIDITVSSIGDAKSLRGGTLLVTPLKGLDGQIYAIGQGNLIVGGFGASGTDGSKIKVNVPVVGRVPNGASVERTIESPFHHKEKIILLLKNPDYTTSTRISDAINRALGANTAKPLDSGALEVHVPKEPGDKVIFLSHLENLDVQPAEAAAKVVINARTGTIIIGKNVKIGPAAITHGGLTVTINEQKAVSQPNPFSNGETQVVDQSELYVNEEQNRMFLFQPGVSLSSIVDSLNQVGAAPGDILAILEALKESGALQAEIEVI